MDVERFAEALLDLVMESEKLPLYMLDTNLNGACAIVSEAFVHYLKLFGRMEAVFVVGTAFDEDDMDNHCWVEWNELIFDLTARQFDTRLPRVLVTTSDDKRYSASLKGAKALQSTCSWPPEQSPKRANKIRFNSTERKILRSKLQKVKIPFCSRFRKERTPCSTQSTIA